MFLKKTTNETEQLSIVSIYFLYKNSPADLLYKIESTTNDQRQTTKQCSVISKLVYLNWIGPHCFVKKKKNESSKIKQPHTESNRGLLTEAEHFTTKLHGSI